MTDNRMKCPYCSKWQKNLPNHIRMAHPEETAPEEPPPALDPELQTSPLESNTADPDPVADRLVEQQGAINELRAEVAASTERTEKMLSSFLEQMPGQINSFLLEARDKAQAATQGEAAPSPGMPSPTPPIDDHQPQPPMPMSRTDMLLGMLANSMGPAMAQYVAKMASGDSGGGGDDRLLKDMDRYSKIAEMFNKPMLTGMQMANNALSMSLKAGVSPEAATEGLRKTIEDMTPKPPPEGGEEK